MKNIYLRLMEEALLREDPELLRKSLDHLHPLPSHTFAGQPLLHAAVHRARRGGLGLVDPLLQAGVDLEARENGRTPLMVACMLGKREVAKRLVEQGANLEAKDAEGWSAAMWATACTSYIDGSACLETLLQIGADARAKSDTHTTLLMLAAGKGMIDLLPLLIERAGDVCERNSKGQRASACAMDGAIRQDRHRACERLLLEIEARQDLAVDLDLETVDAPQTRRVRRI